VWPGILDAAGVEPPVPMDEISVLGNWVRTRLFAEHWGRDIVPNWLQIRTKEYAYIEWYDDFGQRPLFREYYRTSSDPWQLHNLLHDGVASNNPDVRDLRERMKQYKNCSGRSCPGVELTPSYRGGARGPSERRFFIELKPGARAFVHRSERSSLCSASSTALPVRRPARRPRRSG
jgi:hypothetical protein